MNKIAIATREGFRAIAAELIHTGGYGIYAHKSLKNRAAGPHRVVI